MRLLRLLIATGCMLAFCAGYNSATVSSAEGDGLTAIEIDTPSPTATFSHTDIYGNEVDAAVGDYRIDPRGEMYELHTPDTALLKLSSPSS